MTAEFMLALLVTAIVPVPRPALDAMEPAVAAQLRESRVALDTAIANDRATAAIYGYTGRVYHAYSIVGAAEACYLNAESLDPDDFHWPYLLGVLQQEDNRPDAAAASLGRALARPNQYYPAWVRLAVVELSRGQVDAAAAALDRVGEHAPNDPARLLVEGQIAIARREYERAVRSLTRALELQPRANRLHYLLGMAYRELGRLDEARMHLGLAGPVGARPIDPVVDEVQALRRGASAYMIEGHAALRAGAYELAEEAFRRAVDIGGETTVGALVNLAAAESRLRRNADAIDHLTRARQLDPANVSVLYNLGLLFVHEGRFDDAEASFRRALDVAPTDDQVRGALGRMLLARGKAGDGLAMLDAVRSLDAVECAETRAALAGAARSPEPAMRERAAALARRLANACGK